MNYTQYIIKCLTESDLAVSVLDAYEKLISSNLPKSGQSSIIDTVRLSKENELESFTEGVTLPINFESSEVFSFFSNLSSVITSPSETAFRNREKLVPKVFLTPEQTLNVFDDIFHTREEKELFNNKKKNVRNVKNSKPWERGDYDESSSTQLSELYSSLGNLLEQIKPICENIFNTSTTLLKSTQDFLSSLNLDTSSDKNIDLNVLLNYSEIFIALKNISNVSYNYMSQFVYDVSFVGSNAQESFKQAMDIISKSNPNVFLGNNILRKKSGLTTDTQGTWQLKNTYSKIDNIFEKYESEIYNFTDNVFGKSGYSNQLMDEEKNLISSKSGEISGVSKLLTSNLNLLDELSKSLSFNDSSDFVSISTVANIITNKVFPYYKNFGFTNEGKLTDIQKAELLNTLKGRLNSDEIIKFEQSLDSFIASDEPDVYNPYRVSPSFYTLCLFLRSGFNESYKTISELDSYLNSSETFVLKLSDFNEIRKPISQLPVRMFKDPQVTLAMKENSSDLPFKFIQVLSYLTPSRDFSVSYSMEKLESTISPTDSSSIYKYFTNHVKVSDVDSWISDFGSVRSGTLSKEDYSKSLASKDLDKYGYSNVTPIDTAISILNSEGYRFPRTNPSEEDYERLELLLGHKKKSSYFNSQLNKFFGYGNYNPKSIPEETKKLVSEVTGKDPDTVLKFIRDNVSTPYSDSYTSPKDVVNNLEKNYAGFAAMLNLYMDVLKKSGKDTDHRNVKTSQPSEEPPIDIQFESLNPNIAKLKNSLLNFIRS